MTHKIEWIDHGREPQCAPNPDFPDGIAIVSGVIGEPDAKVCEVELPYPAKRCGLYIVECSVCKLRVGVTTAGRADDPRLLQMVCKETMQ